MTFLGAIHCMDANLSFPQEYQKKSSTSLPGLIKTAFITLCSLGNVESFRPLYSERNLHRFDHTKLRSSQYDKSPGFSESSVLSGRDFFKRDLLNLAKAASVVAPIFVPLSANSAALCEENLATDTDDGIDESLVIPKMGLLFSKEKIALFTEEDGNEQLVDTPTNTTANTTLLELPTKVDLSVFRQ